MGFENHFSRFANEYARFRPGHPPELFAYLAGLTPARDLAWDCGTGNGQAALALAELFERVYATDSSADQIARAPADERVEYRVERAEDVSLPSGSVDLVTSAIAVHWFDLDRFYAQVRRVTKPRGVLAVWTYHLPDISPPIDLILERYYRGIVGPYWAGPIQYIEARYRTLPFPFEEFDPPEFTMEANWSLDELAGFLNSWSATQLYREREGRHPLELVWDELEQAWGETGREREVRWKVHLRVGRVGA